MSRFKEIRLRARLMVKEIACDAGVSSAFVSMVEKGVRKCSPKLRKVYEAAERRVA